MDLPRTLHFFPKIFSSTFIDVIGSLWIVAVIAILAAQIRISMSHRVGLVMDILFLLPLVQSLDSVYFWSVVDSVFPIGTFLRVLVGLSVLVIPILYLCALLGFQQVQRDCIAAARMQGLGHFGILLRVLIPQSWGLIFVGLGLGILRILTEGGSTYVTLSPFTVTEIIIKLPVSACVLALLLHLGRRYA